MKLRDLIESLKTPCHRKEGDTEESILDREVVFNTDVRFNMEVLSD